MPSMFASLKFLHSYHENDNTVVDLSNNLIFDKDTFYSFLHPEVVSIITNEKLINDIKNEEIYYKLCDNMQDYLVNQPKTK